MLQLWGVFNKRVLASKHAILRASSPSTPHRWNISHPQRRHSSTSMKAHLMEEELMPHYDACHFYPVRPGEIFNKSYQTVAKLGYGGGSTVWLARCLNSDVIDSEAGSCGAQQYAVLKFTTCGYGNRDAALHEKKTYEHLANANPTHEGLPYLQSMFDNFEIAGPHGTHTCLVFEPLRETLSLFQSRMVGKQLPLDVVKWYLVSILTGLNYIHTECQLVHADLKHENILMSFEHESILEQFVQAQAENPMHEERRDSHSIYLSHNQFGPLQTRLGPNVPTISDFGHAQWINKSKPQINPIQPDKFRAPEVLLGLGWGTKVDIWNLGVMIWTMLEGDNKYLFNDIHTTDGKYLAGKHLAYMIVLLGPPPKALLKRELEMRNWNFAPAIENDEGLLCKNIPQYFHGPFFDEAGEFLYPDLIPKDVKIEDTITTLEGDEKVAFLDFVTNNMLCWNHLDRKSATELLRHPWLADVKLPWCPEDGSQQSLEQPKRVASLPWISETSQ